MTVTCIDRHHPSYPTLLQEIFDPPDHLYVDGRIPAGPMIAVFGSRRATPYGLRTAQRLARDLSSQLGKDVRLESRVDPEILGGLVLQVGDRLTDASVAARLDQLRRQVLVK